MKKKKAARKKYTFRTKLLVLINAVIALLLLLCYLTPYINPGRFPYLAVLALLYPALLSVNILFLLLWLIRGRLIFLLSLTAIMLGFNHLFTHFQFHGSAMEASGGAQSLKIVSYNVHLFGFYDEMNERETCTGMMSLLEKADADVYCFQEFFENDKEFNTVDTLKKLLKTPYVYIDYFLTRNKVNHFGLAIFSRFPILSSGKLQQKEKHSNYTIYTDICWDQDTVRVFNNHLESVRLSKADYNFYEDLTTNPSDNYDVKKGSVRIIRKLFRAYGQRAKQADFIKTYINISPYPVLVCGDFNDTPLSYVYRKISKGLRDAYVQSGFGLGRTYTGSFPSYRIDYILFSPRYRAVEYKTIRKDYSDHYPVMARLAVSSLQNKKNR